MSKMVKDAIANQYAERLKGIGDCLLVNVIGMSANDTVALRKSFRDKGISLLVVKNSLARRACEGTPLAPAFDGIGGANAIVWGGEDFVSLAKEVIALHKDKAKEAFQATGGVMDGAALTPETVAEISKWPNRAEQLSIISGQILSPGRNLAAALIGPGGTLNSQIENKGKED